MGSVTSTQQPAETTPVERKNRTIHLPFEKATYEDVIQDAKQFRAFVDGQIKEHPELFPENINEGYRLKETRRLKKLDNLPVRRIEVGSRKDKKALSYTIHPSFVMPYAVGYTDKIAFPLRLMRYSVPYWVIADGYGKYPQYWYRIHQSFGRNSIVGTTACHRNQLPENLNADEKTTWISGQESHVAMTVAEGCVLGASVSSSADADSLEQAYGVFKEEALDHQPDYQPKTVTLDGWKAGKKAWTSLFPAIQMILCFLHLWLPMRKQGKKQEHFGESSRRIWRCFRAKNKTMFAQRIRRLSEWAHKQQLHPYLLNPIEKLFTRKDEYAQAYDFPESMRTSTMLDQLMKRMDRFLSQAGYFHSKNKDIEVCEQRIRAWALIENFAPFHPDTVKKNNGWTSRAVRFNKHQYHENWLQNLLISSSLGGYSG